MKTDFLSTIEMSRERIEELLEGAARFKRGEDRSQPLAGKSVALVFFNPSLRTRASMQVGIYELGGNAVVLEPGATSWTLEHREGAVMDGDKTEHVAEFVRVLERYCVAIGVRTFAALKNWEEERTDPVLNAFAKYASVSIINLESAMHHPCQAAADMMTIREKLGAGRKRVVLTWAWHPKPLPMAVPNSFALAAAQMGQDLVIAHPPGYELDEELIEMARRYSSVEIRSEERRVGKECRARWSPHHQKKNGQRSCAAYSSRNARPSACTRSIASRTAGMKSIFCKATCIRSWCRFSPTAWRPPCSGFISR